MSPFVQKVLHKTGYVLASLIILAALLVSITTLMTPVLNHHRKDFEKMASSLLETPVLIKGVSVSWHGYTPEFVLDGVTILDQATQKPKLLIDRFQIDFSLWHTIFNRQIAIKNLIISGVDLTIIQKESGLIQIGDLTSFNMLDKTTGRDVQTDKIVDWISTQPNLGLKNINILIAAPNQPERSVTITAVTLRNKSDHHVLNGKFTLNQNVPTKVHAHISWDGDIRHYETTKGHSYFYFESISLPQWLGKNEWQGLQVKKGLASAKLWLRWQALQWEAIQSTFQVYGLKLYSSTTQKMQNIERITANVGWKREGNTEVFAGDEIYLDLPQHLWPESSFAVTGNRDEAGNFNVQSLQLGYVDIDDASKLALNFGKLSEELQQKLIAFKPQGVIKNFKLVLNGDWQDPKQIALTSEFEGLTFKPNAKIPGVKNFNGKIDWNGKEGRLSLNNAHVFLDMPTLFAKPLYFYQLVANLDVKTDENNVWSFDAKNISIITPDGNATANFMLHIPPNDSPLIDLSAKFKVTKVINIENYLPVKIFDPELNTWLKDAFKNGQTNNGQVIVKGKLTDFPFDNNTGQFLVTTNVNNADLYFAPDWPLITNIQGQLTFEGRRMIIDVKTGQLLDIPLHNIRAVIPYIGDDQPQILHVDGMIQGDLVQGLRFIQSSPLKDTIGRDLKDMVLTGPMELKLGLIVPVKRPEETKVEGAVVMRNAVLRMPEWKLNLLNVNGGFQFTENSLVAEKITATLFDTPARLDIKTIGQGKNNQIQVDLISQATINDIEKWQEVDLSQVLTGRFNYTAQLFLTAHDSSDKNKIIIQSDLQGVAVNAPVDLGKKANESKPFILTLNLNSDDSLQAQIDYAKRLSAALNLKRINNKYQLLGGEVRFGQGQANFSNAKGILVTGNFPKLDVNVWQDYFNSFKSRNTNDAFNLLRGIDVYSNLIAVANQEIHNARIVVTPAMNAWIIRIASKELDGEVTYPYSLNGRTLNARFNYIRLMMSDVGGNANQSIDPRNLPALAITSNSVTVNDRDFGQLSLNTVPSNSGMVIRELSIRQSNLELKANGEWTGSKNRSRSRLQGEASSPRISDVLNQWGFNSSNFIGTNGKINFNLSWADAPYRPTLAGLTGNLAMKLGEGRIVELSEGSDAKMGLGRMLNLFSLSTIPRRLSFDFSDLFEKGYSFDTLTGDFTLRSGSAFTENMQFNGPIARVEIRGRVGLQAKDFDLKLGVTPYVTGSLPLVATIAGGPIAGVATLVVDRVISSQVSRVATYQYTVTGSWSNPVWNESNSLQKRSANRNFLFSLFNS